MSDEKNRNSWNDLPYQTISLTVPRYTFRSNPACQACRDTTEHNLPIQILSLLSKFYHACDTNATLAS